MRGKEYIAIGIIFLSLGVIFAAEVSYPSEVSINVFRILYDKFDGGTTDFDLFNQFQLSDMQNVVLEIALHGRIDFTQPLDMIAMAGGDNLVDLNSNVNISDNLINVDVLELPGINKPAVLTLRNIDYVDPLIYKNGVLCPDCTKMSYSSGVFRFSVSAFDGAYYLKENPDLPVCGDGTCNGDEDSTSCPSDCQEAPVCGNGVCEDGETSASCPADCGEDTSSGGGGGGGGGGDTTEPDENKTDPYAGIYDFKVYPGLVDARVKKGSYFQKKVTVENNGSKSISISIRAQGLEKWVFPHVNSVSLEPGEKREIRFDIYVPKDLPADVYLGKILFMNSYRQRNIDFVLQVREREALFDIRTEVLKKYVNPGGRVRANVSMINMGDLRNFDVNLDYMVLDFDRNNYTIKSEQFAINRTYSNVFFLDIPEDIPLGNYIFYTVVSYKDVNATSYDTFTTEKISFFTWILLIIIVLVMMYLVVRWYKKRRAEILLGIDKKKREKDKNVVHGTEEVKLVEKEVPLLP